MSAVPLETSVALSDRRTLGPWMVSEFLMSYASMLLMTGCYDYAEEVLKATPSQRLWISAAWGFAYIFISFLGGRVTEKLGPRAASTWTCGLSVVTCLTGLAALLIPKVWMIPLVMLLFNVTCTMVWPAIESGLTRSPGRMPLSRRMSYYNLAWGSAGFLATFTHGVIESASYTLVFIVPAIVCGLAALVLGVWAIPAQMIGVHNVPDTSSTEHELEDPAVRRRAGILLKMAWITNPLAYLAIYVLIPVMRELTGIQNLSLAAVVGSVWFVVRFVGFWIAGNWTGWHYKVRWQIGPLLAMAVALAAMLLVPPPHNLPVLIAGQVVFGFSAAILYSASLYYSMHVSSGHGGHAAFHEAVVGIGTTIGPVIGALASTGKAQEAMPRIAVAVSGALIVGLGVIVWMALGAKRDKVNAADAISG